MTARRSLDDIRARARAELRTNPTITVYDMHDGMEFNRRPANPWLKLNAAFSRVGEMFVRVSASLQGFADALDAAIGGPTCPQPPKRPKLALIHAEDPL